MKKRRGEMTLPNNINFDEVFNLEEMCNTKMGKKLKALNFTQEKIDMIWDSCRDFYEKYDVCIDPVLYLAIICQEGTGSFNTSSANRAADGQHGYEADYVTDLSKVNSLLYAKLTGYMLYGEEFKEAVNQNCDKNGITSGGTFAQYCNWQTPIVRSGSNWCGVYANHGEWYKGVTSFYESYYGEDAMENYSEYLLSFDKEKVEEIVGNNLIDNDYNFVPAENAQNSIGELISGQYTIVGA